MRQLPRAFTATLCVLALLVAVPAVAQEQPQDPVEAMRYYEGMVEDWAEGPVQYLLTDEEEELWEDLETDEQRQTFKAWFWDRRDPDLRDEDNEMKQVFYQRVATANERFGGGGVFDGWESDRGRTWVILGQPDNIQPHMGMRFDSQDWTYYTVARDRAFETVFGEFHVLFVQRDEMDNYRVYDFAFGGIGMWPDEVLDAFQFARDAYVVNPNLPTPPELPDFMTEET